MALVKEYFKLTNDYMKEYGEKTVILMMVGSFYEIYGEIDKNKNITGSKIVEISKICDLKIANKTPDIVMAGFTYSKIDKYLNKIQDEGYTTIVIVQDTNNPQVRFVEGIYSPGTFFQDETQEISNNVMCIWIERITYLKNKSIVIAVANVDIFTGRPSIFENIVENHHNPTTYDELERYVSIYNPNEVIIISNVSEEEVDDIINYSGIISKNIHKVLLDNNEKYKNKSSFLDKAKKCEKQTYRDEVLNKYYSFEIVESLHQLIYKNEYATQAFVFLLNFLHEHNPSLVNKIREPIFENKSDRVILANHSLKQLNIIDDANYSGKLSSVCKFLNNCITPMGIRKFKYNLLGPTFNIEKLNREYNITEHLIQDNEKKSLFWRNSMHEIKDIEKLYRQIIHKKVTPRKLYYIYKNLETISKLYENMNYDNKINKYFENIFEVNKIYNGVFPSISTLCNNIHEYLNKHFDIEKCFEIDNLNFEDNFILKNVSDNLDLYVNQYENSNIELKTIQMYFADLIANGEKSTKLEKKYDYVKIHETDKMGFSLQATKRRTKILETQLESLKNSEIKIEYISNTNEKNNLLLNISDISFPVATGSNSSIVSSQIIKICDTIIKSKSKMKDEIVIVFNNVLKELQDKYQKEIQAIIDYVTILDILQNKVYIAEKYKYCKPIIEECEHSFVKAYDIRHCLIEHLNTQELYITNDIFLGEGTEQDGILLYGTNAVGKTSLIRALGIAVIMAQAGLYVPCSNFIYNPYKSIFTRILGNDNLFKGMSTFVVEMSELRAILKSSNSSSLILGDELCSGTEMDSAISIFVAGLKKMHDSNSSFIFATHMHEINKYDEIIEMSRLSMKHLSVIYDLKNEMLVYDRKLKDGPGLSMYGLEVCKSLHLPRDFLEYANEIRLKYRNNDGSILMSDTSRYNSNKVVNLCEICKKEKATEVHHLQHQKNADSNNIIEHFHKNHKANLMSICESCHDNIHSSNVEHKRVKTDKGYKIVELPVELPVVSTESKVKKIVKKKNKNE